MYPDLHRNLLLVMICFFSHFHTSATWFHAILIHLRWLMDDTTYENYPVTKRCFSLTFLVQAGKYAKQGLVWTIRHWLIGESDMMKNVEKSWNHITKYFIELNIDKSTLLPFELTKDTPYLALSGELWSVFYEYFNRNWSCYKGFLLFHTLWFDIQRFGHDVQYPIQTFGLAMFSDHKNGYTIWNERVQWKYKNIYLSSGL